MLLCYMSLLILSQSIFAGDHDGKNIIHLKKRINVGYFLKYKIISLIKEKKCNLEKLNYGYYY